MKRINNPIAFARDLRVLAGQLEVVQLERLHDLLTDVSGALDWRLAGERGRRGEPLLRLTVEGGLLLACQRCLGAVPFDLDIDSLLELVPAGAELSQEELEDDSRDFLPVAHDLDVAELVEDEILLALPVAPRHEKCGLPGVADDGGRIHPFAALAGFKGKLN
ncbi:MAG: YceD family protein [Azonexus sp.]|nr:YceD family protein [Azonexus sp.]